MLHLSHRGIYYIFLHVLFSKADKYLEFFHIRWCDDRRKMNWNRFGEEEVMGVISVT
jgi:hypothetical protein